MKWISVKDKLPEGYIRVLVISAVKQHVALYMGDRFVVWGESIKGVTHWMPLPKPPKR